MTQLLRDAVSKIHALANKNNMRVLAIALAPDEINFILLLQTQKREGPLYIISRYDKNTGAETVLRETHSVCEAVDLFREAAGL